MLLAKCHSFLRAERKRAQEGGKRSSQSADCSKKTIAWLLLAKGLSFLWRQEEKGTGGRKKERWNGQLLQKMITWLLPKVFSIGCLRQSQKKREGERRVAMGEASGDGGCLRLIKDQSATHKKGGERPVATMATCDGPKRREEAACDRFRLSLARKRRERKATGDRSADCRWPEK